MEENILCMIFLPSVLSTILKNISLSAIPNGFGLCCLILFKHTVVGLAILWRCVSGADPDAWAFRIGGDHPDSRFRVKSSSWFHKLKWLIFEIKEKSMCEKYGWNTVLATYIVKYCITILGFWKKAGRLLQKNSPSRGVVRMWQPSCHSDVSS